MKSLSICAAVLGGALFFYPASAQQSAPAQHEQHQQHAQPAQGRGMADHDKMMADMKAADARLEGLAEKMKSARGDEKVRAMEDVVSELVKNQLTMHQQMSMMHEHMMSQMKK